MSPLLKQLTTVTAELLHDTARTCLELFKIIIPISLLMRVLEQWGLVDLIGTWLAPLMKLVGLPGELGLVWGTAILTNIYGSLVAFTAVAPTLDLTVAQVTVLGTMILVAHALPVELRIAQKAGTRFRTMALIRILGALIFGWTLNLFYQLSGTLQQPNKALWQPAPVDPHWQSWLLGEGKNMLMIFVMIFSLMLLLRILHKLKVTQLMTRLLEPVLRLLGMGADVAPLTIIGITLGISYGGGLIIREAQSGQLGSRDVFSSLALLGLCHSIFEDTFIVLLIGAHISGIFWGRLLLSLLAIFLLGRLLQRVSPGFFERFMGRKITPLQTAAGEPS